jgi:hypothetical protein
MVQCALAGHHSKNATLFSSDDNMCSKVKVGAVGTTPRAHEADLQDCPHALARSLYVLKNTYLFQRLVQNFL